MSYLLTYLKVAFYKTGKFFLNLLPNTKAIKSFKEKLRNNVGSSDYKASSNVLKETMKLILNEDQSHLLPKISVPTLLFWGSLDKATPISDARKMEKLYIGKISILDSKTAEPIIVDWRAPISNLYYEGKIGKAEYELSFKDQFDTVVVNDNLDKAVEQTKQLLYDFVK